MGVAARLGVVAVLSLSVAACGSHRGTATPSGKVLPSVGKSLGCTYQVDPSDQEIFAAEAGPCGDMTLYRFDSSEARDAWLKIARTYGGLTVVKQGTNWLAVRY